MILWTKDFSFRIFFDGKLVYSSFGYVFAGLKHKTNTSAYSVMAVVTQMFVLYLLVDYKFQKISAKILSS